MKVGNLEVPDHYYIPTAADLKSVCSVWSEAFAEYPMFKYIIPDVEKRKKILPLWMESMATYGMKFGNIVATSEKMEGVGIFVMPEDMPMTIWKWIRSGMVKNLIALGWKAMKRALDLENYNEEIMKKIAPKPFAYLMFGGIRPDKQGMGLATEMLQTAIKNLGEMGIAAYGETYKKKNAMLYNHIGLKMVGEHPVPGTDLILYSHLSVPKKK